MSNLRSLILQKFPWITICKLAELFSLSPEQRVVVLGVLKTTHHPILIGTEMQTLVKTFVFDEGELNTPHVQEFLKQRFFSDIPENPLDIYHRTLAAGCSGLCHQPDVDVTLPHAALVFKSVELSYQEMGVRVLPNVVIATISASDTGYTVHSEMACNTLQS